MIYIIHPLEIQKNKSIMWITTASRGHQRVNWSLTSSAAATNSYYLLSSQVQEEVLIVHNWCSLRWHVKGSSHVTFPSFISNCDLMTWFNNKLKGPFTLSLHENPCPTAFARIPFQRTKLAVVSWFLKRPFGQSIRLQGCLSRTVLTVEMFAGAKMYSNVWEAKSLLGLF